MGKLKHTTTKGGSAIPAHTTTPQIEGLTPSDSPQITFITCDDIALTDLPKALGMDIHRVLAICYEHGAVIRYGCGSPKAGNPRQYWLETGGQLSGQFSGGKTIARFKAHTEHEAVEKAVKALDARAAQETDGANHG